jgi:hypothetical protein
MIVVGCLVFFAVPFIVSDHGKALKHEYLLALFPLLSVFLLYTTFQKSPRIRFDDDLITLRYPFKTKIYHWSSVRDIYLSRKDSFLWQSMEATSIIFDNDDKLNIWQDFYRNCEQMRDIIFQKAEEKIRDPRPKILAGNLQLIARRRYSGNVYTSFNTLLIVGIAVFMGFSVWGKSGPGFLLLFPVGIVLLLFFGIGTQMNYFLIDEGCLFIRNHYFPWLNRRIDLHDIAEVDVETPNKRSTGLRIITKDFKSRIYGAGSLRSKNWNELLGDLNTIGIPARDDR